MMPKSIVMTRDLEGEKSKLNNSELKINRGFELLLRNKRRVNRESPKTFQVKFGKIVSLFKREIHLFFEFHLDIRKK